MKKYTKAKNSIAKNQGITLIALIVTIITMLILAGVSLSIMLGNNGILNKATQAKKLYDVSAIKEALEMEKAEIGMESKSVNLDNYLEQITSGEKAYNLNSTDKIDDRNAEIIVNGEHKFLIKDKENGDVEIIYQGIAKIGDLALSSSSGTYTYPTSGTFTVINNSTGGALSVTSESPDIATVSISGNTITVYPGTTAGKARIIVKSAAVGEYAENRAVYMATVQNGTISISATPYTGTYDGVEHDALTNVTTTPTGTTITYSTDGVNYSSTMPKVQGGGTFTVSVSASKAGYTTKTETYTVTVKKAAGGLTLSATSGTYTYPTSGTFTVKSNTSGGAISATSSNTSIATVSTSGNTITVKPGTTAGTATITVKSAATSNYNEKTATYKATVNNGTISVSATPYTGTYDGNPHNAVTVTTTPSDATKEYSLNSASYTTTMPTVTNASSYTIAVKVSKTGYTTKTETYTVTVKKAAGGLTLSATSGTITYPNTTSITASGNTGTISASSSNTGVATVSVNGNTITITPKNVNGTATITVTSAATGNYNAKSATYTVTVKKKYSVGESVSLGGKSFYVIGDDGTNVTLLHKSTIGTANWANAKTQASTFGSNLGGSGRLMTKAEAEGVAASYRNIGTPYWLADAYNSVRAWDVLDNGDFNPASATYTIIGVRPVVVISKSKL